MQKKRELLNKIFAVLRQSDFINDALCRQYFSKVHSDEEVDLLLKGFQQLCKEKKFLKFAETVPAPVVPAPVPEVQPGNELKDAGWTVDSVASKLSGGTVYEHKDFQDYKIAIDPTQKLFTIVKGSDIVIPAAPMAMLSEALTNLEPNDSMKPKKLSPGPVDKLPKAKTVGVGALSFINQVRQPKKKTWIDPWGRNK